MRVIFRVAAGPVLGFGHLRRAVSLARALEIAPLVSVRGGAAARAAATRLGCRLVSGAAASALAGLQPSVLVIDDPNAASAQTWLRAARARGIRVASIHDLGIAWIESDLLVDGSFSAALKAKRALPKARTSLGRGRRARMTLLGPRYMPLDPRLGQLPRAGGRAQRATVLIALGGGPRRRNALALAQAILRRAPETVIRIAGGFSGSVPLRGTDPDRPGGAASDIVWLPPLPTLGGELAAATVVVTAGGVTLYEACHLGVPAVAVAVSTLSAQRHTVRAAAALGAARSGGALGETRTPSHVAAEVRALLDGPKDRAALAARGRAVVDGEGARRVARAIRRMARNQQ